MFSRIRRRFTYANVAMTIALVFAMSGGAYAAGKYLITSTKQISPKVLKALAGKPGKTGPAGLAGPAGPAGATGAVGATGPAGAPGKEGVQGKEGIQGKQGEPGKDGTTGFTETLPKGKTLKGDWGITGTAAGQEFVFTSVSFGIPLEAAATAIYVKANEPTPSGCTGNSEEPGAEEGHLCVFAVVEQNEGEEELLNHHYPLVCPVATSDVCFFNGSPGTSDPFGFGVDALAKEAGTVNIKGSWAVTAG